MPPIDYDVEYNNQARVPEFKDIFLGWQRDAAAYRAARQGEAEIGLKYGPSARQTIDLFPPRNGGGSRAPRGDDAPLAMFIHGGYWRATEASAYSHMAAGLNDRGIAVAVADYDLVPHVRITTIIEQMRAACLFLWRRTGRRLMVYGHSAGGHLTACMVATDWAAIAPGTPADLVPAGYALSGLFDLEPLRHTAMNADFRLDADEAKSASPLLWPVAPGRTLDAVVGALESDEFLRQSRVVADRWAAAGVHTRYEAIAGANHFTVNAPFADAQSAMTARAAKLCGLVAAVG